MLEPKLNVVLFQPENPHNAGGIARTCALLGAHLHLVAPLGFPYPSRAMRRASMDYLETLDVRLHASWVAFAATLPERARLWLFSDAGRELYSRVAYAPEDYLVFGRESDGLPTELLERFPVLSIPMPGVAGPRSDHREHSLNVSVSVAVALSEAMRQITGNWEAP